MSRIQFPLLHSDITELLTTLESYERDVGKLVRGWRANHDLVLYGEVSEQVDRIRELCGALPQTAGQWVALLISHTELMQKLWRITQGESLELTMHLEAHLTCVGALVCECRRLLANYSSAQDSF